MVVFIVLGCGAEKANLVVGMPQAGSEEIEKHTSEETPDPDKDKGKRFYVQIGNKGFTVGFSSRGLANYGDAARYEDVEPVLIKELTGPCFECVDAITANCSVRHTGRTYESKAECRWPDGFIENSKECSLQYLDRSVPLFLLQCEGGYDGGAHPDFLFSKTYFWPDIMEAMSCDLAELIGKNGKLEEIIRDASLKKEPACGEWEYGDMGYDCTHVVIDSEKTATMEITTYLPRVARGMPCDQMSFYVTIPIGELDDSLVRRLRKRQARLSGLAVTLIDPIEEHHDALERQHREGTVEE